MIDFSLRSIFKSLFEGFSLWRRTENHSTLMRALRSRIIFAGACGLAIFLCISYRLADIMIVSQFKTFDAKTYVREEIIRKADIVDRNGELIATSLTTASCYADPSVIIDVNDAATKLSKIKGMPCADKIKYKLRDKKKHFVWILRHITPKVQEQIMDLGIPGIRFQKDYKRIYIHGNLFSHVIGYTDIDGIGIFGLEKQYSDKLGDKKNIDKKFVTSLDLRLQSIVYDELTKAIDKFSAQGGNAILMSTTGEVLAMVSLPDFDSNDLRHVNIDSMFNRNTLGVFEQGSILKILNVAIALDSGAAKLGSIFDASEPIKIGRFTVRDFKGKNRPLTLAEAFVFSSNIASARIAQSFGSDVQKEYMKKFGMFDKPIIELPERGRPIVPVRWTDATCMTVSYGYGLAVTPLQLLTAVSSIVNGGKKVHPTLLYNGSVDPENNESVVSLETSAKVRDLMRAVVCFGTGKKASVDGVEIFGKTGTAYKMTGRGYGTDGSRKRITTFLGGFPRKNPKYMLLVSLDDPKATSETFGYATAGWNIAPTAHNIFERIIPILHDGSAPDDSPLRVVRYLKLDN